MIITFSASQMWWLRRLLPLITDDLVPEDCKYWLNLIKLLKIVDTIFAPEMTNGLADYLAEPHYKTFTKLYLLPATLKFMYHMPQYSMQ